MTKKENTDQKKIKILAWMDSPTCPTGFATVARGIFNELGRSGRYDIDIIGINERGGYHDPKEYPYHIYPARPATQVQGDFHGRPRLINTVLQKDPDIKGPWDIIFTLNDPYVLEQPIAQFQAGTLSILKEAEKAFEEKMPPEWRFKIVSYFPVDSSIKPNWVQNSINIADYPIAYTNYAKDEIIKSDLTLGEPTNIGKKLEVIYHGVDVDNFKPLPKEEVDEFRKTFFKGVVKPDTFLVLSVARNQMRKDLPRTLAIFKEFQKRRPDSFLYLHCQETDAWGSLREYARHYNLEFGKDWGVPKDFNSGIGFSVEAMNLIYNAADCILSTTQGEGWGFYNSEGFATKTIVIAPNNTVHPELFNYDSQDASLDMDTLFSKDVRGVPIKAKSTLSEWATYGPDDLERVRPLTNIEDGAKKLIWVYDNPEKVAEIAERAYNWIQQYSWKNIGKQWDDFFTKVYNDLETERAKPKKAASK